MIPGRVTVVIPGCNEYFMQQTIDSLLAGARDDVEILAVLDGGPWPNPPLKEDPRVKVLRNGQMQGMRQSFNAASAIATGQFIMKCDAHCLFGPGWDEALKAHCEDNWLAVPTRHSIHPEAWKAGDAQGAIRERHYNYHALTYPFLPSMYGAGFHAVTLPQVKNQRVNAERAHLPVDDILSAQGSCWFTQLANVRRLGPLNWQDLYFYQESQEVFFRQLATGGRCVINKGAFYCHLHKGNNALHTIDGRIGRGFFLNIKGKRKAEAIMVDWCLRGWPWPGATRSFEDLIEQHWWLIAELADDPGKAWPEDWREWEKYRAAFEGRPPEALPAHV